MHETTPRARFPLENAEPIAGLLALLEDEVSKNAHGTVARARFPLANVKD